MIFVLVVLALLPILIACVRSVGFLATVLILPCVVVAVIAVIKGFGEVALVTWIIALIASCAATNGRHAEERKRHAETLAAMKATTAPPSNHPVDRFLRGDLEDRDMLQARARAIAAVPRPKP